MAIRDLIIRVIALVTLIPVTLITIVTVVLSEILVDSLHLFGVLVLVSH